MRFLAGALLLLLVTSILMMVGASSFVNEWGSGLVAKPLFDIGDDDWAVNGRFDRGGFALDLRYAVATPPGGATRQIMNRGTLRYEPSHAWLGMIRLRHSYSRSSGGPWHEIFFTLSPGKLTLAVLAIYLLLHLLASFRRAVDFWLELPGKAVGSLRRIRPARRGFPVVPEQKKN
jgi:hypothetical protein